MNSGRRLAASAASKRQHSAQQILSNLLAAEVAEKKARSIRYQLGDAKLPLAKPLTEFDFTASPINEILVRDPHDGSFLKTQRNAFCIGGTGTGKTHIGIAITANCVRCGARACFFNLIDLVNGWRPRPGPDGRGGSPTSSPASISSCWTNWAYLPFSQIGGQLLFHLVGHRPTHCVRRFRSDRMDPGERTAPSLAWTSCSCSAAVAT